MSKSLRAAGVGFSASASMSDGRATWKRRRTSIVAPAGARAMRYVTVSVLPKDGVALGADRRRERGPPVLAGRSRRAGGGCPSRSDARRAGDARASPRRRPAPTRRSAPGPRDRPRRGEERTSRPRGATSPRPTSRPYASFRPDSKTTSPLAGRDLHVQPRAPRRISGRELVPAQVRDDDRQLDAVPCALHAADRDASRRCAPSPRWRLACAS